jgi:hypothetical protein
LEIITNPLAIMDATEQARIDALRLKKEFEIALKKKNMADGRW